MKASKKKGNQKKTGSTKSSPAQQKVVFNKTKKKGKGRNFIKAKNNDPIDNKPSTDSKGNQPRVKSFRKNEGGLQINTTVRSKQLSKDGNQTLNRKLVVKPVDGQKWFMIQEQQQSKSVEESGDLDELEVKPILKNEILTIETKAVKLLDNDCLAYKQSCTSSEKRSDFAWMDNIMSTGTLPDKMAAFIVRVQDSPIHNLHCLQQLLSMVKVQGRQQCLITADTARDLFLEDLLPPGRKLISFENRGPKLRTASDKQLILWLYEHRLKRQYQSYIEALKRMSTDQVDKMRGKAIVILSRLLIAHPEQEQAILQLLVNKLGDPVKKIASKALFHLNEVVRKHPAMKFIVVQEVERLLFRNNIGKKAQYYGICFLNIINVSHTEAQLAVKLVNVCLAFFKACVKTGEIDSKLMGGLLTGVNRSYPIAKMVGMEFTESLDTLFKIVQLSHFTIGIQALSLLFHVTDIENNSTHADRFYNSLYRKLMSEDLFTTSHSLQFINLIYKAMKKDSCYNRVLGFAKRLLQVCSNSPPNVSCALLFLLSEVSKVHKGILLLGKTKTPANESGQLDSKKAKNKKSEAEDQEKRDIESRANQVDVDRLIRKSNIVCEEKEEEIVNVPEEAAQELENEDKPDPNISIKNEPDDKCRLKEYDPVARNPKFCGAELTFAYELLALSRHVHPSVSLFAKTLLRRQRIKYSGNPLKDFTVARFLGRFVFRNAKVNKFRPEYQPSGLRSIPVNSSNYLEAKEEDVPVEEKFFYKYFKSQKKTKSKVKPEKDGDDESDAGSIDDDEFESIMGNYFKTHGPSADLSEDEEEVDFASEINKRSDKKRKRDKEDDSEEDDQDDENDEEAEEEGSDEEGGGDDFVQMDSDDEPEYDGDDDDLDNEDDSLPPNMFDDDEDDLEGIDFQMPTMPSKSPKKKGKGGARGLSTFAPAEQFSEILEANADLAFSGSNDLINKDNADVKQLKWEVQRDRWVKGYKNNKKDKSFKRGNKKRRF